MQRRSTTTSNDGSFQQSRVIPITAPPRGSMEHEHTTEKDNLKQRKKRRKAVLSAWSQLRYELARHIEEDGPFMLFVGFMGCILITMIALVGFKLLQVVLADRHGGRRNGFFNKRRGGMMDDDKTHRPLPFHPIYKVPEAMEFVGDRSSSYAKLRKEYDTEILPLDLDRSLEFAKSVRDVPFTPRSMDSHHSDQVLYDIYNCPHEPPPNYPFEWKLTKILDDWPVNDNDIPDQIHQGLCVFDYVKDYAKAMNYRNKEQPFVIENDPEVARTVERWHQPGYVEKMIGPDVKHRAEYNTNNHFLYHMPAAAGGMRHPSRKAQEKMENLQDNQGRKAQLQNEAMIPETLRMTYNDWVKHANVSKVGENDEHWYYRLIGCGYMGSDGSCDHGSTEALFDELPYFQPKSNLYIGDPEEQKGVHCRFGMKGVIAENHFDGSRNAIAVLMGKRRYILAHPNNCDKLTLLPMKHPSARHSAIDYTNPDLETYPEFKEAKSNEVVLQPGQVLYLPTNWFHFIVSLELNMQCNTRSGLTDHYMEPLKQCGF
mmetsp:Transcript_18980/g.24436  ORF Transcript_18980/g.24436 Transcript_18980/m.24436 type:complete len:541 (-) Transcript_18980:59-1681(-)|eukprot:CAMPEP_0198149508 /NCGR_PEP_ID=MMETSP1443-20131203/46951_1 /TAXON_ID=186043 /ORGANISM="Entomoneis sp., Strain CCMP2396" /LENGTH=540 /DNA_ID=CAMNT_0043814571 /DNA_START=152 /DNA_END=1774 /DNA_ORIENTATION=+